MKYNTKIKNKNVGYAVVGNKIFSNLCLAEIYCDKHNLDPDDYIKSENKETLAYAKEIAVL